VFRTRLAKIILFTLLFPFMVYILGSCILNYIPPEESYKKASYQLERSFNKNMEQYGMSVDFSSSRYERYEKNYSILCVKTVPIICTDESNITCTIYTNITGFTALIKWIRFEQTFDQSSLQNNHIETILAFILQEFETFSYKRPDTRTFDFEDDYETYNSALEKCSAFLQSEDEILEMRIASYNNSTERIIIRRSNEDGQKIILEFGALFDKCPDLNDYTH